MRRLAIAFSLVLWLVACAEQSTDELRFGLASPPVTLDPRYATDATSVRLCRLIYESLVDFDSGQRPVPSLADWTRLSPLHYRFRLRETNYFHDRSVLDSADVVATYRAVLDPATRSPHRASLTNIRSVSAPSAEFVDFELAEPDPLFPGLLVIGIVPLERAQSERDGSAIPIGSGSFAVREFNGDDALLLERVRDGQRVEFVTIRDATVRALKLAHGEIDLMQGAMGPELVRWLARQEHVHTLTVPGSTFTYLGFNLEDEATGNAAVRRAIAHAIDRRALTRYMFGGDARLAEAVFPPTHWAGNAALASLEHDPARARALLAEQGYDAAHPLHLTYKTSSDHFRLRIATVIQQQLAEVGIKLAISSYDWGTFYADIKAGRFQMYALSWVGLKQPDIFRYAFHSTSVPPTGANRGRYRSDVIDRLIEGAEQEQDLARRAADYARIQQILHDDLPYVPLWYEDNVVIHRARVSGYDTNADGYYDALKTVTRVAEQ